MTIKSGVLLVLFLSSATLQGQERGDALPESDNATDSAATDELVVATKEAPPFVTRGTDGEWSGISISLWEAIADALELEYRFEEAVLADMVDGVADGRFDVSIAATTITTARERTVDFSHPFYSTGFGIAVRRGEGRWWERVRGLLSIDFLRAIALLTLLLAMVGACFWLAERRRNPSEFRPGLSGLGDGFWFSAVTMTTTGYGDMAPRTLGGRLVGLAWMFSALLITSTFTGMIASALTAERLSEAVTGPADLVDITTGSITGTASDEWLLGRGVSFEAFESVAAGLEALARDEIGAFVYDRPLLQHLVVGAHADTLELVPGTFGRQDYGIALPPGSALREPLNQALLRHLRSEAWEASLTRWLGRPD